MSPIKQIAIVGGGTAGWLTAARLAAHHKTKAGGVAVTLIESSAVPIAGVGEGTWPTLRSTLSKIGVSETEFIIKCDATFKQGARFDGWQTGSDSYFHAFADAGNRTNLPLERIWQSVKVHSSDAVYANEICFQAAIAQQGKAPKDITHPEYDSVANYAYHLDAGKFATFMREHCINNLGVKHVIGHVECVNSATNGDIASLTLQNGQIIEADLFVDCSGFHALLIGKHYDVPFISQSQYLFADTALAVQVPYEHESTPIASQTIATAQEAGWIWDIGLHERRGVGHVYSSSHMDEKTALDKLDVYLDGKLVDYNYRKIPIRSGHREVLWKNNCVAIGLSAGFFEPLEASAIALIELSADMLTEQLPTSRYGMDFIAKRYNKIMNYHWQSIIDFIKLHYCISKRTDSQFWIDNQHQNSIPESLQALLQHWRHQPPMHHDFALRDELFPTISWQYVLYGMGFETDFSGAPHLTIADEVLNEYQAHNKKLIQHLSDVLPAHRELINKIKKYGMSKI
ncbi:tryptophan halogenase family protein [Paraferrimonas sp. SM1919]|uniref:tryptophan halogenase family protein n=1 Tax=Paraferrimonas sp. SM1919 TaxID=2662263 RepID=UPI0013D07072|nr:tryptophan halogenase family protein [Paraferrimonas sp. SM1919]